MHHAHLNGAEAAPAREDKGRPGPASMNRYRQGFDRSFIDAPATGPAKFGRLIAAGADNAPPTKDCSVEPPRRAPYAVVAKASFVIPGRVEDANLRCAMHI
jgi:hypothetical protein